MQVKFQQMLSACSKMALLPSKCWPYSGKPMKLFCEEVEVRSYCLVCSGIQAFLSILLLLLEFWKQIPRNYQSEDEDFTDD